METEYKKILVMEVFGPLVGTRLVTYTGKMIDEKQFLVLKSDGTLEKRELCEFGSKKLS